MQAVVRKSDSAIGESELILREDGSLYHLGVKPEDIAHNLIIVGDPDRVSIVSSHFDQVTTQIHNREFVIHTGIYHGKRITVVSTGIGVDNIDIVMNELDAAVNVDLKTRKPKAELTRLNIVRIGTCGSMHEDIPVGSFVASVFAFGLDGVPYSYDAIHSSAEADLQESLQEEFYWLSSNANHYTVQCDTDLLERIGKDTIHGITATANGFYGPQGRSLRLQSDMESRIDQYAAFRYNGLRITNFEMECSGIYALAGMLGHKALTLCVILANRVTKEFHKNPSASIESLIRQVLDRF